MKNQSIKRSRAEATRNKEDDKNEATHQTNVGVKAHLNVFPVKLNPSGSHPQRKTPVENHGRTQTVRFGV